MNSVDPLKRAAAPVFRMNPKARRLCLAAAGDNTANGNGADHISNTFRDHMSPETVGAISISSRGPNF